MDILVRRRDKEEVLARLQGAGYQVISGCRLLSPEGIEVDLIIGEQPWLDEALLRPEIDPAGYPVLGFPYLVLTKMNTGISDDLGSVATMLGWASAEQLRAARAVVARYSPEDSEDLESLIFLGQQEQQEPGEDNT